MPNLPIRGVGTGGIITDRSPYDLDSTAWSSGRNIRFTGGRTVRYSHFKDAFPEYDAAITAGDTPVGGGLRRGPGGDIPYWVTKDFDIVSPRADGSDVLWTPDAEDLPSATFRTTEAFVGGVTYLNREDYVPLYLTPSGTEFAVIPSWDEDFTCKSLRAFGDFLIAMNVTKDGALNPALFKWTNAIQYGTVADFDLAPEDTLAGENVVNDAQSGLVDGWALRDDFVMYTSTDVYLLSYIGGDFILAEDRLFSDDGVMSVNCVVEVDNKHFVFGNQDIYVHDGITKQSITADKIKVYLYSIINMDNRDKCLVYHDTEHSEIGFAFNTLIDEALVSPSGDCNMAAVYNYSTGAWSFVDLPSVVVSARLGLNAATTWDAITATWEELSGTWTSFAGSAAKTTALLSSGWGTADTRPRFLLMDDAMSGRIGVQPVIDYQFDARAERLGIDMDEIGAELIGNKLIRMMVPQVRLRDNDKPFLIQLGRQRTSGSEVVWGPERQFDPKTTKKLNSRINGSYLAMRLLAPEGGSFDFSGYDLDLIVICKR